MNVLENDFSPIQNSHERVFFSQTRKDQQEIRKDHQELKKVLSSENVKNQRISSQMLIDKLIILGNEKKQKPQFNLNTIKQRYLSEDQIKNKIEEENESIQPTGRRKCVFDPYREELLEFRKKVDKKFNLSKMKNYLFPRVQENICTSQSPKPSIANQEYQIVANGIKNNENQNNFSASLLQSQFNHRNIKFVRNSNSKIFIPQCTDKKLYLEKINSPKSNTNKVNKESQKLLKLSLQQSYSNQNTNILQNNQANNSNYISKNQENQVEKLLTSFLSNPPIQSQFSRNTHDYIKNQNISQQNKTQMQGFLQKTQEAQQQIKPVNHINHLKIIRDIEEEDKQSQSKISSYRVDSIIQSPKYNQRKPVSHINSSTDQRVQLFNLEQYKPGKSLKMKNVQRQQSNFQSSSNIRQNQKIIPRNQISRNGSQKNISKLGTDTKYLEKQASQPILVKNSNIIEYQTELLKQDQITSLMKISSIKCYNNKQLQSINNSVKIYSGFNQSKLLGQSSQYFQQQQQRDNQRLSNQLNRILNNNQGLPLNIKIKQDQINMFSINPK